MALILPFLLGMINFAMQRAVLESGHPALGRMPWFVHKLGGRIALGSEFAVLLAAMLMVGTGATWAGWVYAGYTAVNAVAVWLIVTRRV